MHVLVNPDAAILPTTVNNPRMHETDPLELELSAEAARLSQRLNGAPVVIVVAGDESAGIPRTMTATGSATSMRLRDLLGILQTAIQIESWKHFKNW